MGREALAGETQCSFQSLNLAKPIGRDPSLMLIALSASRLTAGPTASFGPMESASASINMTARNLFAPGGVTQCAPSSALTAPANTENDIMTKTQAISAAILDKIAEGMGVHDAMKAILGADKVEQMISDLYDELRQRPS